LRFIRLFGLALLFLGGVGAGRAAAQDQSFAAWLSGFRGEAVAAGIQPATFDGAFAGVQPIPRIIELDHAQPESKMTFSQYLSHLDSAERRDGVRKNLAENGALLTEIGRRYHVQPRYIVALWGIETDFGRFAGDYPVIAALATLAYDGRRAALFKRELISALRIVQRDNIAAAKLRGSWAGAMGQCQFMPSSFLQYAVSYGGDGRPDIWTRRADVFASIANYLARLGWRDSENWGRLARAPANLSSAMVGLGISKSLNEWARLGVKREDDGALPASTIRASLLMPEGPSGPSLLVYDNFRTILKWNNSSAFAASVGLLADSGESR